LVSTVEPPLRPEGIEETGIEKGMLLRLLAKWMTIREISTPSQLADDIKLSVSVVIPLLEELISLGLVESRGLAGQEMSSEIRYALTMQGGRWAAAAFEQSQYIGPAPVSLDAFCARIEEQRIIGEHVDRDTLASSLLDASAGVARRAVRQAHRTDPEQDRKAGFDPAATA